MTLPVRPAQPILPHKKKRSVLPTLALGMGAGAAGLGAVDYFFNKGRFTNTVIDSIKQRFGGAKPPAPPTTTPAPLHLPRTDAEVQADASSGYIGADVNSGARNNWRKWLGNQRFLGENTAFDRAATEYSMKPKPDITHPLDFNQPQGLDIHNINNVNSPGLEVDPGLHLKGQSALYAAGTGASLTGAADYVRTHSGRVFKKPPVLPAASRLGRASALLEPKGYLGKGLAMLGGGIFGIEHGSNPLMIEALMDRFPNLTPEQAAAMSVAGNGLLGTAVARANPLVGGIGVPFVSTVGGIYADKVRELNGASVERGALGDLLARMDRGARTGNPLYVKALKDVLTEYDANPGLQESVTGVSKTPWWRAADKLLPKPLQDYSGHYLKQVADDQGSPQVLNLIERARQLTK